jgi:hypothetical protein
MNIESFRLRMNGFWHDVDLEAATLKGSYLALEMLHGFYAKLDHSEKNLANIVLSEWLLSGSESKRFDALALIGEFSIISTMPALDELARMLSRNDSPSAPFDLAKVNRLIEKLSA